MTVEELGKFSPPDISCNECKAQHWAQGAGRIFRVDIGKEHVQLCGVHMRVVALEFMEWLREANGKAAR